MGTRTVIDERGIVNTSGTTELVANVPVTMMAGVVSVPSALSMSAGSTTLGSPGFYYLPSTATASLPAASSQPGATYIFAQPLGDMGAINGGFLTGTSPPAAGYLGMLANKSTIFFNMNVSASNVGKSSVDPQLANINGVTLNRFSTVSVTSDSKSWCVSVLSGSVSGSFLPANG